MGNIAIVTSSSLSSSSKKDKFKNQELVEHLKKYDYVYLVGDKTEMVTQAETDLFGKITHNPKLGFETFFNGQKNSDHVDFYFRKEPEGTAFASIAKTSKEEWPTIKAFNLVRQDTAFNYYEYNVNDNTKANNPTTLDAILTSHLGESIVVVPAGDAEDDVKVEEVDVNKQDGKPSVPPIDTKTIAEEGEVGIKSPKSAKEGALSPVKPTPHAKEEALSPGKPTPHAEEDPFSPAKSPAPHDDGNWGDAQPDTDNPDYHQSEVLGEEKVKELIKKIQAQRTNRVKAFFFTILGIDWFKPVRKLKQKVTEAFTKQLQANAATLTTPEFEEMLGRFKIAQQFIEQKRVRSEEYAPGEKTDLVECATTYLAHGEIKNLSGMKLSADELAKKSKAYQGFVKEEKRAEAVLKLTLKA